MIQTTNDKVRSALQTELNQIRNLTGMTTHDLATRIRVPKRTLDRWVRGQSLPADWVAELVLERARKLLIF